MVGKDLLRTDLTLNQWSDPRSDHSILKNTPECLQVVYRLGRNGGLSYQFGMFLKYPNGSIICDWTNMLWGSVNRVQNMATKASRLRVSMWCECVCVCVHICLCVCIPLCVYVLLVFLTKAAGCHWMNPCLFPCPWPPLTLHLNQF